MSGYIDENARIADDIHNAYEEGYADGKRDAMVHGHWEESNPQNSDTCRLIKCSKCGFSYIVGFNVPYEDWIEGRNYCVRCGALMDEVTE